MRVGGRQELPRGLGGRRRVHDGDRARQGGPPPSLPASCRFDESLTAAFAVRSRLSSDVPVATSGTWGGYTPAPPTRPCRL